MDKNADLKSQLHDCYRKEWAGAIWFAALCIGLALGFLAGHRLQVMEKDQQTLEKPAE
jgi:hypothetical protein